MDKKYLIYAVTQDNGGSKCFRKVYTSKEEADEAYEQLVASKEYLFVNESLLAGGVEYLIKRYCAKLK